MIKVWINGSNGQIGKAINDVLDPLEYEVFNTDRDELDITNIDEVLSFADINRPDVIINCASITDTTQCEQDHVLAYKVNALGARNLSIAACKLSAKIVQLSTDDVFDGKSEDPYSEFDVTNPISVYGKSKLAGENYVKEFTFKHFIIRSTWVYGEGKNFVNDILEKVENNEELAISSEHTGSPTSANELARFIMYIIQTNEYGTYHATCKGRCTRYEFAQEVLRLAGKKATIKSVGAASSDFSAERPAFTVLNNFIMSIIKVYDFPDWKDALSEYMLERK